MKMFIGILLGVAIGLTMPVAKAVPPNVLANSKAKVFKVGLGKPAGSGHTLAATTTGGSLNVTRGQACTSPDGSGFVTLVYTGVSGNALLERQLTFPATRTSPVMDNFGNQIAAQVPAATGTSIDSFGSQLDTQIGNAAGAGKLNVQ